jgi:hypothetical protein
VISRVIDDGIVGKCINLNSNLLMLTHEPGGLGHAVIPPWESLTHQ